MTADPNALFSLEGKKALVTGASRGLGRAMAEALAGAGASVVCASSRPGGSDETVDRIRAQGAIAHAVSADLSDRTSVAFLAGEAERLLGPIDVLVNNAGTIRRHPAEDFPDADWDEVLETNLNSVFILCRHFGRAMIARRSGKIINVASMLSFTGGITVPAYTASKHAVAGLTRALANEWAKHNVQVNAIAPGYFRTDNTRPLIENEARYKATTERIPAERWGEPEDLAGAAIFLASRASDYVNGSILVVDGGWMAR